MLVIEKYEFIQERVIGIALKTIAKYGNCFQNNPPVTVYSLTSDSSLKNSWAAHGPGNSNRLEIVFEELFWSKRLFADKIRSERTNFTKI